MYKVSADNMAVDFEVTQDQLANLDLIQVTDKSYNLIHNHHTFNVEVEEINLESKTVLLKVAGKRYQYVIQDELDILIDKMGLNVEDQTGVTDILAPMPGLVLAIQTEVGASVAKGQTLVILEAMKMENTIKSQADGVIKQINVNLGDSVDKGQILIEFE